VFAFGTFYCIDLTVTQVGFHIDKKNYISAKGILMDSVAFIKRPNTPVKERDNVLIRKCQASIYQLDINRLICVIRTVHTSKLSPILTVSLILLAIYVHLSTLF